MAMVSTMLPLFITLKCAVLSLVGALDLPCTVTQEAGLTDYLVPEFKATSATDCLYSWTNRTGHVLANNGGMEPTGLVVNHSNSTLTTNKCLEGIGYKLECISEGVQREAKCIFHCNASAGLSVEEPETRDRYGIIAAVVLLVVILAVAFILWRKKRKNPSQTGSTSYTEVPMQSLSPQQT